MGNAFVAIADDASSVYYNPAGLAFVERPKVMASHSMLYSGLDDGSNLGLTNLVIAAPIWGGRLGTAGFLWSQFSLSGVYTESALQASYGFRLPKNTPFEKFAAGASVKYLTHSFSRLDESYNAMDGIYATGEGDPVLMGKNSKSAIDIDAGLVYNLTKRYTIGAAVMNIRQADVGFASADPVPMKMRLGGSYKSLWMIMTAEARMQKGPAGKLDKDFIFAAEKVFPSLDRGDVGIRASLGAGDRDFRQVTAGLSYKINKIQFDYGFSIPLGTVRGTVGNHRLALAYHFGSLTSDEQHAAQLLGEYKQLRESPDYSGLRNTMNLNDPRLKDVKALVNQEKYYAANRTLMDKANDLLPNASVINLVKRMGLVAAFYPSIPKDAAQRTPGEQMLSAGIQHFLRGYDAKAVRLLAFSQGESPRDTALSNFLDKVEETSRIKADRVPPGFNRGYVEYKLQESDALYAAKKYDDALIKLQEILEFDPGNILVLKKTGSCNYLLGNYAQARKNWETAVKKETDPAEKEKLTKMVSEAGKKAPGQGAWEPEGMETGNLRGGEALAAPAAAAEKPATGSGNAREIEKLYRTGADYYTKGDYGKAADNFRKILTLDPENSQAKKALERIIRLSR
ncbi:MAG: type IX secretion system membrane protein PorP/SprF [Elusimicrobia bacterium]|nr:type IX secretion system membrane protein PorP/SprF [Elusimicrobiota bacterium]